MKGLFGTAGCMLGRRVVAGTGAGVVAIVLGVGAAGAFG
jgi:hypothetical protein